jgi:peptide/nickel transport system permease protein
MGLYLLRRSAGAVLVVVFVAAITWIIVHTLRPESFVFDERPTLEQFTSYMKSVFWHFDLDGYSDDGDRELTEFVREGVPKDLQLIAGGTLIGLGAGIGGGLFCAVRPRALVTRMLETAAYVFLATPVYVFGLGLILLFGAGLGTVVDLGVLLPAKHVPFGESPARWLGSMLAPWLVLSLPLAAFCLRMTTAVMCETLEEQFIRTAEMKGVSPRAVVRRHALPPSAAPVISLTSVSVPIIVTNMVLVEHVFSIPGVFQNTAEAMDDGNFPLLQSMTIVAAALVAAGSLILDVVLARLDPRVRLSARR